MTRLSSALLLLGVLLLAPRAQAATPISGVVELKLGGYKPGIDGEGGLSGSPYAASFGDRSLLLFQAEWERQLFQEFGSLAVGVSAGYGEIYGHGHLQPVAGGPADAAPLSGDSTSLKVVPLKALLVYRFDVLARHLSIPLVPFAKGGLVYQLYRIEGGSGSTSDASGLKGEGGRSGYEGDLGLALLLDVFDPQLAKDFDIDLGVNHTYFFAEMSFSKIDDFGSKQLRLGDRHLNFGLALEY